MCVVSNVGDYFRDRTWPDIRPKLWPDDPWQTVPLESIDKKEFERLKKEVEELKKLLTAAKAYDEATGQKDCHMDEKVALIKKLAEITGVDLEDVFK